MGETTQIYCNRRMVITPIILKTTAESALIGGNSHTSCDRQVLQSVDLYYTEIGVAPLILAHEHGIA